MKLEFATSRLAKDCADDRARLRAFGTNRKKKLGRRLSELVAAANLEVLRNAPGRWHELHGDRKGQFAVDLDGPFRLIFEAVLDDALGRPQTQGVWSHITHVRILEIVDYHG